MWNCCNTSVCPLNGECKQKCVLYQTPITTNGNVLPAQKYVVSTETNFKQCYSTPFTIVRHERKNSIQFFHIETT